MKKIAEKEIIDFLNKKYPQSKAEAWDFVGYSVFTKNYDIEKILLCLDVNEFSINKAIKEKVNLIISFHPFKFGNTWQEIYSFDLSKKEHVKKLKNNKINVFAIHTNFDQDKYGMKYWFNKKLDISNEVTLNKFSALISYNDSLSNLISHFKKTFKINTVLTNVDDVKTKITKFQIYPGAGDIYDFIKSNKNNKNVLLVTSDIKWNEQQLLNSLGYKFMIIPHKCEDVFVEAMDSILTEKFPSIKIVKFTHDDFVKGY